MTWRVPCAGLAVVVLTAGGCAGAAEEEVTAVAERFHQALADSDGTAACRLLAASTLDKLERDTRQACERAVLEEIRPSAAGLLGQSAFGTVGQVRYRGETTFLARYRDGWRVLAAGCAPAPADTYECAVEGG